jgi:hypothetical protein
VYLDDTWQVDLRVDIEDDELADIDYTQSADTLLITHEDIPPIKIVRGATHVLWTVSSLDFTYIPKFAFVPSIVQPAATLTPSAKSGNVSLTASAGVFLATDEGGIVGGNGGEARILEYVSATKVLAWVTQEFVDTAAIASGSWDIERGYEDVWSANRGWPRAITFHDNALFIGGSRSRPNTVWRSRVADFFNFDPGVAAANDALELNLQTDAVNAIRYITSADAHLIINTKGSEFYADVSGADEFNIRRQDTRGSRQVKPVFLDGALFFVQEETNIIREMLFNDAQQKYSVDDVSLLSGNLINAPVSMAHQPPNNDYGKKQAIDYVYVVNGDGTWTVMETLRSQELVNWVSGKFNETTSKLLFVAVDRSDVFCITERLVNAATVRYIERFRADFLLDAATKQTGAASATWSNLDHLEGEVVYAIADGVPEALTYTVTGGSITVSRAVTEVIVGKYYEPLIETLPPERELPDGTMIGEKRRIVSNLISMIDTLALYVDDVEVKTLRFGTGPFQAPTPFTGVKKIGKLGYSREPTVKITQKQPWDMHIVAIVQEVSF